MSCFIVPSFDRRWDGIFVRATFAASDWDSGVGRRRRQDRREVGDRPAASESAGPRRTPRTSRKGRGAHFPGGAEFVDDNGDFGEFFVESVGFIARYEEVGPKSELLQPSRGLDRFAGLLRSAKVEEGCDFSSAVTADNSIDPIS